MIHEQAADRVAITYYTDPLCCWSWAMEPQWRKFRFEFRKQISWRFCMGGLIPAWKQFTDPVHAISRPAQMGPLWMEAAHLSGMPLQNKIWAFDPPASSYPACIAVKCAEAQSFAAGEYYLRLLREAIMIDGKNIASQNTLLEIAALLSAQSPAILDLQRFKSDLKSDIGLEKFRLDLDEIRLKNIRRFPTLVFRRNGQPPLALQGYRPYTAWVDLMHQLAPEIIRDASANLEMYKAYWPHLLEREAAEWQQNLATNASIAH